MKRIWAVVLGGLLLFSIAAFAQRRGGFGGGGFGGGGFRGQQSRNTSEFNFPKDGEFAFNRLKYTDNRGGGFRNVSRRGQAGGWWAQDWPDAENHLTVGLQRLTLIGISEPVQYGILDPEIFDYPWTYSTQNHYMTMTAEEIKGMREYLDRGGFLMTDDMYDFEGDNFYQIAKEVYPEQDVEPMTEADPMMHVHYDIQDNDRTFIPGERHLQGGGRVQNVGTPGWFKMSDKKGHVVMAINANTDMGDAWEYADAPYYPAEMTTLAYHYGVNYVIYSMTH